MDRVSSCMSAQVSRHARQGGMVLLALAVTALASTTSNAFEIASPQAVVTTISKAAPTTSTTSQTSTIWSANDSTLAQLWNLSIPEVQRARILMQGPRGAFSSPQLTPIEALGIHARTEAERDRYARLFAQVTYDDTQRVLAWSRVAQGELQRLAAGQDVLNFDNVPKAAASYEAADMLGVPRSVVVPTKRASQSLKAKPVVNKALGRAVDNRGRSPASIPTKPEGAH
ncbi:MAG: hypothetical protein JF606_27990 [Burkholderiales bacterium]|jgi:hypothetical protein|nr:hypothetical protein [Burkholderiales bacterium]